MTLSGHPWIINEIGKCFISLSILGERRPSNQNTRFADYSSALRPAEQSGAAELALSAVVCE